MAEVSNKLDIIFFAHGELKFFQEVEYAILSLLFWDLPPKYRIFVYSTNPDFFKERFAERVKSMGLTLDQIQEWRGPLNFVHRAKIKLIENHFKNFNNHIFYSDGDVVFHKDPTRIFADIADKKLIYFHTCEGQLQEKKNPIFRKLLKFLKKQSFKIADRDLKIPPETEMWNAGCLGLSYNQSQRIEDVLKLTDMLYTRYQKHVMEQLAFSYIMQNQAPLNACDTDIIHYWNFKIFRQHAQEFLNQNHDLSLPDRISKARGLIPVLYQLQQNAEQEQPKPKSLWTRLWPIFSN